MESFLRQYEKDCMKMEMMKHEETFREQVNELHRLYEVQKLLMRQLKKSSEHKRQSNHVENQDGAERSHSTMKNGTQGHRGACKRALDLELPAEEYIEESEVNHGPENEQESDVELTLSIGGSKRNKDVTFLSSDSGSFSSYSTETMEENKKFHDWRLLQMLNTSACHPGNNKFDVKEPRKRDGLAPRAWQHRCLSLNMTW